MTLETFFMGIANTAVGSLATMAGVILQHHLKEKSEREKEQKYKAALCVMFRATMENYYNHLDSGTAIKWNDSFWEHNKIEFAKYFPAQALAFEGLVNVSLGTLPATFYDVTFAREMLTELIEELKQSPK